MTRYWWRQCWKWALVSTLALGGTFASSGDGTNAQIKPDTTLPHNSIVMPLGSTSRIEGGTRAGNNLFHSFTQFSLPTGGTAYFNNAPDVRNIFTRVTGSSASLIDGTLQANGMANLFLLNPNGIIFGQNAQLHIGGSFVATTANGIGFGNQGFFSAAVSSNPSLLTVEPSAFLFNQIAAQSIKNQGSLQVPTGQSLLLLGGNVTLDDGQLLAPGGRVELGGLAASGTVGLDTANNIFHLTFPADVGRADVLLTNSSNVHVESGGGGSIAINAQNFTLMGSSHLFAGIAINSGVAGSLAGNIDINAIGTVNLNDRSVIGSVNEGAIGNGSDINITASSLYVTKGAEILSGTSGKGNSGIVNIHVDDIISFDGSGVSTVFTGISSNVDSTGIGNSGDINITTNSLSLTNGGAIYAIIFGQGNAGNVNIHAASSTVFNNSNVVSEVASTGVGNSGDINITTKSLSLTNSTGIDAKTLGQGNAGSVNIHAASSTVFNNSNVFSQVESTGVGNSGDINITTNSLSLTNSAEIFARTLGKGNAGSVNIHAASTTAFDNGSVASEVLSTGVGNSGDINITTNSLSLTNGAIMTIYTSGKGDAGSINIHAASSTAFDGGSFVGILVTATGVSKAGNVNITAPELIVKNGSQLLDITAGQENAGNININASSIVRFDGAGEAYTMVEPGGMGNAGNVNITAPELVVTNGSQLLDITAGQGNAGNININASSIVRFDGNSGVLSTVLPGGVGNAGNINITAPKLAMTNGSQIAASTLGNGNAGSVNINVSDTVSFDGQVNGNQSGVLSSVEPGAVGNGNNINIKTSVLSVTNGALLIGTTKGTGNAGNVNINANSVRLDGVGSNNSPSGITSQVIKSGVGNGGNINITSDSVAVTNGAVVGASTLGQGNAGKIALNANSVTLSGVSPTGTSSGLVSSAEAGSSGTGNNITVKTNTLRIDSGAVLSARTASTSLGGDISVDANTLQLIGGGEILTTTFSSGNAGNISVHANNVTISGIDPTFTARVNQFGSAVDPASSASGIFANTGAKSTGTGGDLTLLTQQLNIQNGAQVTSSSLGTGNAGNILNITANSLNLDNGSITTTSRSGEGGNIENLQVQDLRLRHHSNISTSAGINNIGSSNGGNIGLNTKTLVSLENSNITANAYQGKGGNINIDTQGIFSSSDSVINASSQLGINGTVTINTPGINPTQGLTTFPTVISAPQLAVGCLAGGRRESSQFVVTGRGGLPPNAIEPLGSNLGDLDADNPTPPTTANSDNSTPKPIVEAHALVRGLHGELLLVSQAPQPTVYSFWHTPITCRALQTGFNSNFILGHRQRYNGS